MTKKTNKAKELLELLYSELDWVFDDKIKYFKEESKNEDDEEYLSYLIWLRSEIKDELNIKQNDELIKQSNKSIKH